VYCERRILGARQAVSGGTSWFRGSTLRVELPVAVPGPACAAQTTCALASERSGSTMHRESEPATSSLRYATGRPRSAPALHKIGPAGHRLPRAIAVGREPPRGRAESTVTMIETQLSAEGRARWLFAAVLLCGGLAAAAWYRIDAAAYASYEIRTHDTVSGLAVDAPVEFHGVEVGKVAAVELAGPASVRVLLRVRKDAPVSAATVATITSRGLASRGFTGYVYVALDDDGRMPVPLAALPGRRYPQLRTAASHSLNLDTAIADVSANVQVLSRLMQRTLDERSITSLHDTIENLQQVTHGLAGNGRRLESIAVNLQRAGERLGPLLDSADRSAATLQARVLPQASRAFVAVDGASVAWHMTAERTRGRLQTLLAAGNDSAAALQQQLLPQAYDTLADLQRLTTTLGGLAQRLQRDPSLLVRASSPPPAAPGEAP
jgi:phospholipid/cholesterol/gamma-HCH transport system substrate-binding protein